MDRYEWPGDRDPDRRDDERSRAESNFDFLYDLPGRLLAEASALRNQLLALFDPSEADTDVWLPIGPSATVLGQGGSEPRVAGRVRDLAVSPDGQRIYAASANGGVWYSGDAGTSWSPIGGAGSTPSGEAAAPGPSSLVTSTILVDFGAAASGADDTVYVGTGELRPYSRGYPGGKSAGIGILKLDRPLPDALHEPHINPWKREAPNLEGVGVFRLAHDPTDPDIMIAATSIGLFKRVGPFVADADWTRVTAGPFDFEADDDEWCTDVFWARSVGATPKRLWVCLVDDTLFTDTGVWVSEGGVDGPYSKVGVGGSIRNGRLGIAVHHDDPSIAYVLGKGPKLWRIDGTTARRVRDIPSQLFGSSPSKDQSSYDLAVEVHPSDPTKVILGGSTVQSEKTTRVVHGKPTLVGGEWSASLFRLTISGTAASNNFSCDFDQNKQDEPGTDDTYIGDNVHADVHVCRYTRAPAGGQLWVGCDGGVYRSLQGGDSYTFVPRNAGLAVVEAGYVANHPTIDGVVIIGTQDNGAQVRIGDTIWKPWVYGDGGGVAFHPSLPAYYVGQYTSASWYVNKGRWTRPVERSGCSKRSIKTEDAYASFYSDLHVIPGGGNKARVVLGTNRVWISEDWDPSIGAASNTWKTLPSGKDPRLNGRNNTDRDTLSGGQIRVVQWAGPPGSEQDRILALGNRRVIVFNRQADGKWKRKVLKRYNEKCGDDEIDNDEISQPTSAFLPPLGSWSDLAVHAPARGTHGSFYVAATGHASFDDDTLDDSDRMDTLWWFDGTDTWHPTGLRGSGNATKAPCFAVVVDPDDATTVYAGTAVGVWKGALSFTGDQPQWAWSIFSNGLPDAIVQDLSFFRDGPLKLLRAAMQARGVWEVDLSAIPGSPRRTYLRAHPFDTRRRFPTDMTDPDSGSTPPKTFPYHESPDIQLRPAPGSEAPLVRPAGLPWTRSGFGAPYQLWTVQTAMHADDPLVRPVGRWHHQLDARIRAYRSANGLSAPDAARIDQELWDHAVVAGKVWAAPWDGSEPTEADLHELIQEERAMVAGRRIVRTDNRPCKVDVLVHHRHFQPVPSAQVQVMLLRREIAAAEGDGGGVALSDPWKAAVVQRFVGATPALPDGWTMVGLASPTSPVSARMPRAVTFDLDLTPDPPFQFGTRWLLLAVVSSNLDVVSTSGLDGGTVEDLVRGSHHVAARLVTIFI